MGLIRKSNRAPHVMRFYEKDIVKVREDKIKKLFYSNPIYLRDKEEEDYLKSPESFLKRAQGVVVECDWDWRRELWSHFVELSDKKNTRTIRLWFLETELEEVI